jgi:predicted HicB family RNase H-like nuclease
MMVDHYTYRVSWSEEDGEYVGTCAELPSLSHLAPDRIEALRGIAALVRNVITDMKSNGEPVPEPLAEQRYSGKFMTRVPSELHRQLAIEAAEAHVGLNRLVSYKLAMSGRPVSLSGSRPSSMAAQKSGRSATWSRHKLSGTYRSADPT